MLQRTKARNACAPTCILYITHNLLARRGVQHAFCTCFLRLICKPEGGYYYYYYYYYYYCYCYYYYYYHYYFFVSTP